MKKGTKRFGKDIKCQIISLYKSGLSLKEVAQKMGCSGSGVRKILIGADYSRRETGYLGHKNKSKGDNSPKWKGGKIKNKDGYIMIYNPDRSNGESKYLFEHRYIWEKIYNRKLPKNYFIHHLNGIKDDNRPENLIGMRNGEHIHQTEPFKKRIRELELEVLKLKQLNLFP